MKTNLLRAEIVKAGMTHGEVAKRIGMSPKTFSVKLNKGVFGLNEAQKLIDLLEIKNPAEIFFTKQVT
jgi:hypothetical protein